MKKKRIIIVDDLECAGLFKTLGRHRAAKERFWDLAAIEEALNASEADDTLILINAHAGINGYPRCSLRGMWLLRYKIRTEWRRREPVIIYSPMSREEFLRFPHNAILNAGAGQYFFNIAQMQNATFLGLIKEMEPVPVAQLDFVIRRYGTLPALINKYAHHDLLAGELQRDKIDVRRVAFLCEKLAQLVPERFWAEFQVEALVTECKSLQLANDNGDWGLLKKISERIRELVAPYGERAKSYFTND